MTSSFVQGLIFNSTDLLLAVANRSGTNSTILLLAGVFAVLLAIVHLFAGKLRFQGTVSHRRWLSFGSGVSVAYVFVHLLPELSESQEAIRNNISWGLAFLEHHVYLMALLGLAVFYGLERLARISRRRSDKAGKGNATEPSIFWIHISSFALYNALIGYLLLKRGQSGIISLVFFFIAMALHFVVNDDGLREHHQESYDHKGRWILSAAVVTGWIIGSSTTINEAAIAILFGFLAGSVVLNVLKEELPEEQDSRFWSFALGAASYTALLLVL
jgi:zinc transporter ZupT